MLPSYFFIFVLFCFLTWTTGSLTCKFDVFAYMHICHYVCVYTVCVYIYIYICVCVCVCVCVKLIKIKEKQQIGIKLLKGPKISANAFLRVFFLTTEQG